MEASHAGTKDPRRVGLVGRGLSWIMVVAAAVLSVGILLAGVTAQSGDNATASLPDDAESAQAARLQDQLATAEFTPAFVVLDRGGEQLTEDDKRFVASQVEELQGLAADGQKVFPVFSEDGEAAFVGVPLSTDIAEEDLAEPVQAIRDTAEADLPEGLDANVTGGPAFTVDLSKVFDGADVRLLVVTASVVALLLLITYRSPLLWLVPLTVVGLADRVAAQALAAGTHVFGFSADGATTGITSVLVFGAGTNYALLLIARYREQLRTTDDRYDAMRIALGSAAPAILASSGTVVLALLCLGFSRSDFSSSIGFGGAIGIVVAVVFALLVLPAAMTVLGRGLFWPFVPRVGQAEPTESGFWSKVAGVVTVRPVAVGVVGLLALVVLALPLTGLTTGLSQTEQFRAEPDSVVGQKVLGEHFPAGASQPTSVLVASSDAAAVRAAVEEVEGVQSVDRAGGNDETTELSVVLAADPESAQAFDTVTDIRDAVAGTADGVLVGGADAQGLDSRTAAVADLRLIIPLILAVVLLVLVALLRSVVAALVLVTTVVASYAASLGASWWAFTHWFDFPALDLSVPLLSFLFLVALGVDYNIFLTTRAKEEAAEHDTATAIGRALAVTGGVITSAGILLAAVFTVLGVLPLILLTQIGIIVGFGVLLDTIVVRSLLVPAVVALLGRRFWWPGPLSRESSGVTGGGTGGVTRITTPQ